MGAEKILGGALGLEMSSEVSAYWSGGRLEVIRSGISGVASHRVWDGIEGRKPENQQIIFSEKENICGLLSKIF